jgi:hypothetical protein
MMRIDSFGRSAIFAAAVALGWIAWLGIAGLAMGVAIARALYFVAATALYTGALAPTPSRRMSTTLLVGAVGLLLAAVAGGGAELALGLAIVLGTVRSVFLHRASSARAVVVEGVLLVGGLVFARFLASGTAQPTAFALWGFFLVQSCFFLVGGIEVRRADGRHPDPFEEAHARAIEVIERGAA